jgi:hypothetical protein
LGKLTTQGNQTFVVSYYDADPVEGLPVNEQNPVAIRVQQEQQQTEPAQLIGLRIERMVEYRIRPRDDPRRYPVKVAEGTCFVIGDNVPVSVDSRDIGLVPISRIAGLIAVESKSDARP